MSYIESELEALEREQEAIDLKASALEKKLRSVMGGTSSSKLIFVMTYFHLLMFRSVISLCRSRG